MDRHSRQSSMNSRHRSSKGAAQLSEFALVLYVLFFIILVPVVDLGCLLIAAATQYLATNDFAAKAAAQPDYMNSLNAMFTESQKFETTGMSKFMNMTPQGGYVGSGNDLYVITTNISSGGVQKSAANNSLSPPIDTTANVYELAVNSKYSFNPVLNLAGVPILGNIPGLGQPVTFTFVANRPVEHPGGLVTTGNAQNQGNVAVLTRNNPPVPLASAGNGGGWRVPNIYQQIAAAGQTVISTNVVVVQSNNPNWTPANVNVSPPQKIWVDTQAVGVWSTGGSMANSDANGLSGVNYPLQVDHNANMQTLIAQVGSGSPFTLGDDQLNLPVSGSGALSLLQNDEVGNYGDNTGAQIVRIIVTQ